MTPHNAGHSDTGRLADLRPAIAQVLALGRGESTERVVYTEVIPHRRTG